HKGMGKYVVLPPRSEHVPDAWRFVYPNTADFNFNYYQLLDRARDTGIARNTNPNLRIAIVGTGVAGLKAAHELFRSGYTNIDLYEASDRIAGRTYSIPAPDGVTSFELGAMRFPFFPEPGSKNCVFDYERERFGITTQDFPDPGSATVETTGIYLNQGRGPDPENPYPTPRMDLWKGGQAPPTKALESVYRKWSHFADMFTRTVQPIYDRGGRTWQEFWQNIVSNYWAINFRELAYLPAIPEYNPSMPGYFGGLGMTEQEAWNFYTIGAGDGGWGAFYDICSLYPMRTLLFGFGTDHQLIQGTFDSQGAFTPGPGHGDEGSDSLGNPLAPPTYLGIQCIAECLFYRPVKSGLVRDISLYEAIRSSDYRIRLFTRTPVHEIRRLEDEQLRVTSAQGTETYDAVVVTPTTWALEMSTKLEGFDYDLLPYYARLSINESHWITSAKVFYPLTKRYWEHSKIPQIMTTDTFLQGIYGYAVETGEHKDAPGVLLISYTWEDDATKLLADQDDNELGERCLRELDDILTRSENIGEPISPFVDRDKPVVIHWACQPTYRGCSKLYRERTWNLNYALLTYNQEHSARSGLYFAGEAYSVHGGWTEPALRLGLDAVVHLAHNTGAQFQNGFDFERDYPRYDARWQPTVRGVLAI
ncbi:MAG: FAD-dependent oxidoreductase, partial [Acidobacteriota bacterium]